MRQYHGIVIGLLVASCGVSESTVGSNEAGDQAEPLSSTSRTYVGLRPDQRKCASPMCGGYFVHDLNRSTLTETYVSGLDFSTSTLSDDDQSRVFAAPGDVVLRGKLGPKDPQFGTRAFLVSEAWRGLPGLAAASGDAFYKVQPANIQCITAPCPTMSATRANYTAKTLLHALSLTGLGFVQQDWLSHRVTDDGAIAAAHVVRSSGVTTLEVSDVFVKLPETAGPCPKFPQTQCPSGKVQTYTRTADRCIVPDQCVTQGICNFLVPNCGDGYASVNWVRAPNACQAVACDPSWIDDPTQ